MKFLAIDLKTTGLQADQDQILRISAAIGDFATPLVEDLPVWEMVIAHQRITGHPYMLGLNAAIIDQIARRDKFPAIRFAVDCKSAYHALFSWLTGQGFHAESDAKIHLTIAGRNGTELAFLNATQNDGPIWRGRFQSANRAPLDPTLLYFEHGDSKPPDFKTCLLRAGISRESGVLDIARLLRFKIGMEAFDARSDEESGSHQEPPR